MTTKAKQDEEEIKTFKIRVVWRHTIEDYADVEIEAKNETDALKRAEVLCTDNALSDDDNEITLDELNWNDGEVVDGEYLVADDTPITEVE